MVSIKKVVASFLVVIALKKMADRISAQRRHHRLLDRAERKRKQRDTQISGEFTPAIDIPEGISSLILNATVNDLLNLLNEDRITSEQILRVYHNRAITIGLNLELIAESNFKEALELARQCDETRKNTPKEERSKLGSMFGIPISIKDSIEQKNLDSTCGLAKNCFEPCVEDAGVIKLLKAQGAIPFIRTNTSQALRALDCSNHIWGRGLNPWCVHRSVGGSSGGDGGLIASKCSPVGFGSDVYGSIRLPAAFNGICGFKPTSGRYAASGHTLIARQDILKFSLLLGNMGPLGRCVQDLVQVVKGLITPESGVAPYIPWDEEKYQSKAKLKIGYVVSEDFFGASKACKRAVKEAVRALEKLGYETVEIKIPNFEEISLSVISLLAAEGKAQSVKDALAGEKPTSDLELFTDIGTLPNFAKKLTKLFASERISKIISRTLHLSTNKFMLEMSRLQIMKGQILQNWAEMKLDAIVTPATALPAWKHGYGSKLIPSTSYLWIANVVNLPSGIVPITKVQPGEDTYEAEDSVYNKDVLFRYSQECMQGSVGLPVGVQVLSMPWEDEKCLSVMKAIEANIEAIKLPEIK